MTIKNREISTWTIKPMEMIIKKQPSKKAKNPSEVSISICKKIRIKIKRRSKRREEKEHAKEREKATTTNSK
jgi:hypothetical protein